MLAMIHLYLGLAFLFLALGYYLPVACNMCGVDAPNYKKSLLVTLIVTAAAFFFYDFLGFVIIAKSQDDTHFYLPTGYGYLQWLKEPAFLKWQVLGLIPVLRYLLVAFSLCLAAILNVLILKTPYRVALVVFMLQWVLGLVTGGVFSFLLALALNNFQSMFPGKGNPDQGQLAQNSSRAPIGIGPSPEKRAMTRVGNKSKSNKTTGPANNVQPGTAGTATADPSASHHWMEKGLLEHEAPKTGSIENFREQLHKITEKFDPYLEPIKDGTRPYTKYLPVVVQEFLDDGGWWLIFLGLAMVFLMWLLSLFGRIRKKKRSNRRRKTPAKFNPMRVELRLVSDALTEVGTKQIVVRHRPGRLRVVILAPSISYVGEMYSEMADNLLDYLHPGLAEVLEHDQPKICVWPRQINEEVFLKNLFREVRAPEAPGRSSHWILVGGTVKVGRQRVFVGLAIFADIAGELREIRVPRENWELIIETQVGEPV